ncbi:MAG: acyclic terpene utilization AtuA family protein [Gammaproteobacteria bacterium]
MKDNSIRIANCSGFYGDKLSIARDMIEGGPIDVLTGDYLAELTMTILYNQKLKRGEEHGYVGTFLKQFKDVAKLAQEKDIKIVTNAGGLNPSSMAAAVEEIVQELNLDLKVAYIEGDDLMPRIDELYKGGETLTNIDKALDLQNYKKKPITANAYLGAWGIKEALDNGADVVICPRVTDAAVVIGPAAWKYNWSRDQYDELAGALAAGHIIECGAQATGGNYSFFQEVPTFDNIGYPIAEIYEDGSFVITKHENTGGLVSVGTVTAQLLYEIGSPAYLNPDVISHFDTLEITQESQDRVLVKNNRGSSPTKTHKVCINLVGGYRNGIELLLTGLDIEEKSKLIVDQIFKSLGGQEQFDKVDIQLHRTDKENPTSNEEAQAFLRIDVMSSNPDLVGRLFNAKIIELALANFPGWTGRSGVVPSGAYIEYWPALVNSKYIKEHIHIDGKVIDVIPTSQMDLEEKYYQKVPYENNKLDVNNFKEEYFGKIFGTRSGDKGGCANLGVWAKSQDAYSFLFEFLTVKKLKELMPDLDEFQIDRYELPNILSLNFYVHGILQDGVSSSTRMDGQAKSLGEYLRAKKINFPEQLLK